MLRKLTIGFVAAVSLSTIALAPTAASAHWSGGWGFHHQHFGGGIAFIGGGVVDDGCYVTRTVFTPYGYRLRTVNICAY